jgi:hypothetical protein
VCVTDFATLIGQPTGFFTFPSGGYEVDFMAAGLVVACCALLIFTTAGGEACFTAYMRVLSKFLI